MPLSSPVQLPGVDNVELRTLTALPPKTSRRPATLGVVPIVPQSTVTELGSMSSDLVAFNDSRLGPLGELGVPLSMLVLRSWMLEKENLKNSVGLSGLPPPPPVLFTVKSPVERKSMLTMAPTGSM